MTWLESHINEFVIPHWRAAGGHGIPNPSPRYPNGQGQIYAIMKAHKYMITAPSGRTIPNVEDELIVFVRNTWKSIKAHARALNMPVILPGRDAFCWEILARRDGFPSWYNPRISRLICDGYGLAQEIETMPKMGLIVDTGFVGSIISAIRHTTGRRYPFLLASQDNKKSPNQIFPRHTGSRNKVLRIENLPKYWKRAFMREGKVFQDSSGSCEIMHAAWATCEIFQKAVPKWIPRKGDKMVD